MKSPRIERRRVDSSSVEWPAAIHPVLRRIFAARGITTAAQIEYRLTALQSPQTLGGVEQACDLLENALREQRRIVVVGDFDCDGATGAAVAVRGLRLLGARHVDYGVPNRFTHGYGLSPSLVEELLAYRPDVLITVDNGIAAHAGVAAAKRHGIRVIVTDHHLPGETLPDADAIVNPNLTVIEKCAHGSPLCDRCAQDARLNKEFPSKALAGVGVMFYLLLALRARLRDRGWFSPPDARDQESKNAEPDLSTLLDLVALGTVADLVPLDYNNRVLVEAGLRRIRGGRACAGIAALLDAGSRDAAKASAADLGFVVAPRINAVGRLEDIRLGIECLLCDDLAKAQPMAERLSAINSERRDLQAAMVEQAEASVQKWILQHGTDTLPVGVVLFEADWHHGVVGLVASKLKEALHRPVIACAPAEIENAGPLGDSRDQDERRIVKASGRSIPGFHLRDALAEIDVAHPGLLLRFGGHAMAAGLNLRRADIDTFAAAFDRIARTRIPAEQLDAVLLTDGELGSDDFSIDLAQRLRDAGPWGQTFPEPLFDGVFDVASWQVMGETHLRLKLRCDGLGQPLGAVMFNGYRGTPIPQRIRAAYQLTIDDWNDRESLRLLLRHIEPA